MSETLTDPKAVVKDIESKLDTMLSKIDTEKASKTELDKLNKLVLNLKATLAAQGEDADREIKKYPTGQVVWTNKMRRALHAEFFKSFDAENLWRKSGNDGNQLAPEALRKHYLEKATNVNEIDATSGLGMLQTMVDSVIHQLIPLYGVARRNCRVLSGVRGSINLNSLTAYPSFGFTITSNANRDDSTVTPNSPTYTKINIQPNQVSGIAKVTEKLIFDAVPGVLENVAETLAIQAGLFEDQVLFLGDGTATYGGFTGLKTATIGYNDTNQTVRNGSFTNFDPLLSMQTNIYPSVSKSPSCKYHMHPFTFAIFQTFKASTSGLYFYDIATSTWKITGRDIEFNQVLDTPNANGTYSIGAVPVIFGDLNRAVTMAIGRDMTLKTLLELYAATNEIGLRLTYDYDFGIVLSQAVTRLSVTS